jgi:hypothetical protein
VASLSTSTSPERRGDTTVLHDAHVGDIHGAFGTIRQHDVEVGLAKRVDRTARSHRRAHGSRASSGASRDSSLAEM